MGFIRTKTLTPDCLLMLYSILITPKRECASIVWDSTNLQSTQRNFAARYQNRLCSHGNINYEDFLKILEFHTIYDKILHIHAYFSFLLPQV